MLEQNLKDVAQKLLQAHFFKLCPPQYADGESNKIVYDKNKTVTA